MVDLAAGQGAPGHCPLPYCCTGRPSRCVHRLRISQRDLLTTPVGTGIARSVRPVLARSGFPSPNRNCCRGTIFISASLFPTCSRHCSRKTKKPFLLSFLTPLADPFLENPRDQRTSGPDVAL